MIVLDELFRNLSAMLSSHIKNADDSLLINIKDTSTRANAVAFCQSFQHSIDSLFVGVEAEKDAVVSCAETMLAFQTTKAWSVVWSIKLHKLEIIFNGFAAVGTT